MIKKIFKSSSKSLFKIKCEESILATFIVEIYSDKKDGTAKWY